MRVYLRCDVIQQFCTCLSFVTDLCHLKIAFLSVTSLLLIIIKFILKSKTVYSYDPI